MSTQIPQKIILTKIKGELDPEFPLNVPVEGYAMNKLIEGQSFMVMSIKGIPLITFTVIKAFHNGMFKAGSSIFKIEYTKS